MNLVKYAVTAAILVLGSGPVGSATPVAVSPGAVDTELAVHSRCPTFSWGAVEDAENYELAVHPVQDGSQEAPPALEQLVDGTAVSWTPSLDRCLKTGRSYAWAVRVHSYGFPGEWSEQKRFRIWGGPAESDVVQAVMVLHRFLRDGGSLEDLGIDGVSGHTASAFLPGATNPVWADAPPMTEQDDVSTHHHPALRNSDISVVASGLNSLVATPNTTDYSSTAVSVRGEWISNTDAERAVGHLGLKLPRPITGDLFDGIDYVPLRLGGLSPGIGVLGAGHGDSNIGVLGAVDESSAIAGLFFNAESGTEVKLAGGAYGLGVTGTARVFGSVVAERVDSGILETGYAGAFDSSGDYVPEVYRIDDSTAPVCDQWSRGAILVMQPSGANGQDALCFCGLFAAGHEWWCFNP